MYRLREKGRNYTDYFKPDSAIRTELTRQRKQKKERREKWRVKSVSHKLMIDFLL